MSVVIPDEVLDAAGMSSAELKRELAVLLFRDEKLTLAQASRLAEMSRFEFQHLLASRRIPIHYDVADLEKDVATLREMNS